MRKLACIFLMNIFVLGCTSKPTPVQVYGEINLGHYTITPPNGYWYFPKEFPTALKNTKDIFVITFWEKKETALRKEGLDKTGVFFNFAVSGNTFRNFKAYYDAARELGISYRELPGNAEMLKSMADWSCKRMGQGVYGIECISLKDKTITIGVYADDEKAVLAEIPLLQKMVESFTIHKI